MKLGARAFKTGLAVTLSIILAQLISVDAGVIAGISAVPSTQPSVAKSYSTMRNRLIANTIGGFLAAIIGTSIDINVIVIGLATVLLIAILNYLKLSDVISLAAITMIVIMLNDSGSLYNVAAIRVAETFIGVIIAFLVNTFIHPPRYGEKLYHIIDYATSEFLVWISSSLRKNTDFAIMNKDLKWARVQLARMDYFFELLQESKLPFTKYKLDEQKQLVIYRRMIRTTRAAYGVLLVLHDYENSFFNFPQSMRITIRERMETLMTGHEQIMLKFSGRIAPEQVHFFEANKEERKLLLDNFFKHAREESNVQDFVHQKGYSGIHLMSAILEYEDELIKFNKAVSNFRQGNKHYHISQIDDF
ncbi:aromatic acid exporter family protein [Jeotgalibaca porci]|uniref:Aromatic acid exporter family protein n=3 Tax=Jeotgalibaca porci TaxID=1868793 RepID=A0A6G7WG40_9LACT|nr:aromatic acid exporter family protein [Jeotgalibaca porci]QIK51177.1 aromatic acid exporter family protein [Jeotgalibaca porci]